MAERAAFVDPFAESASSTKPAFVDPFAEPAATPPEAPRTWSDVPMEAVKNFPSSVGGLIADQAGQAAEVAKYAIPKVLQHGLAAPAAMMIDAGKALYQDPSLIQKIPAAVLKSLVNDYGSEEALKKTIATNPAKVLLDASMVYGAGRSAVSRIGGEVANISRAADVSRPFHEIPRGPEPVPVPPSLPPEAGSREDVIGAAGRLSKTGEPVQIARAVASDLAPVQQAGVVTSNVPYVGTPLVRSAEKTIGQLGTKADEVTAAYGAGGTAADTGELAAKSIKDWITGESKVTADKAYGKVDQAVDKSIATPLNNTLDTISKISAQRTAAGLDAGKASELVLPGATQPGGLTYEGIKTLRTSVGELLNNNILPADISGGELKQIYGALTKDLGQSVEASGPKAKAAFDRANKYYQLVSDRREALAKIVGAEGDAAPERVFDRLVAMAGSGPRADINKLTQARKVMGSADWNELASSAVSRLGRDVEGNFSPQRFITDYNKMSEAGRNLLFKSTDVPLKGHLDDISTVSSRFKQLQKFANPSGTARVGTGASLPNALFAAPMTTITTLLGTGVAARMLARPAEAASLAKWSRAKYALAASPSAATLSAYSIATSNLLKTAGITNVTKEDFMRDLKGAP